MSAFQKYKRALMNNGANDTLAKNIANQTQLSNFITNEDITAQAKLELAEMYEYYLIASAQPEYEPDWADNAWAEYAEFISSRD